MKLLPKFPCCSSTRSDFRLFSSEFWLALFHKCANAFFVVVGLAAAQVRFGFAVEQRAEVRAHRQIDVGFHVTVADLWTVRDTRGDFADLRRQLIRRDDAID